MLVVSLDFETLAWISQRGSHLCVCVCVFHKTSEREREGDMQVSNKICEREKTQEHVRAWVCTFR